MVNKFLHKNILLGTILLIDIFSISGCSNNPKIYIDGYFEYIILEPGNYWYRGEKESVAIIGFTESALIQETIIIPKTINNIPVEHLGYTGANGAHAKTYIYYPEIEGKANLKNIYFYDNIVEFTTILYDSDSNDSSKLNVFCCSKNRYFSANNENLNIFCYNTKNYGIYCGYYLPNVVYSYNVPKDEYYFMDKVSVGDVLEEPKEPSYEGYSFTGWYLEPECINKYGFQNTINLDDDSILFLYAGWEK
ncbi:MAG: InlB B-repeat-containing protein [Bacilli bacterium]|nr:InlB B-repeat-containing protein [Bacilli bacterium]